MKNEEWRMKNEEWRMKFGEWSLENGLLMRTIQRIFFKPTFTQ